MSELPAARWAPDPYGRHELRFWDGVAWTAHVSDGGVTSHDLVPGVAAGQAAARSDEETAAMPVVVGGPSTSDTDDPTVAMPVVPSSAVTPGPAAAPPTELLPAASGAGVGALFGGGPVPVEAPRAPVAAKPRTGLVAAVAGLAVVGLAAGIIGFNGLGGDGGSDGVVPLAASPTSSAPTDPASETASEDPTVSETFYGGPTTSPASRTTTKTVASTTTTPKTSTTTKPRTSSTVPRTPRPSQPPTTVPQEFRQYPSCEAMHRDYPHGVGRPGARDRNQGSGGERVRNFFVSTPLYFINAGLDTDQDGIACEA